MAEMYLSAFFSPTISSTSSMVKAPLIFVRPLAMICIFSSRSEVFSNL